MINLLLESTILVGGLAAMAILALIVFIIYIAIFALFLEKSNAKTAWTVTAIYGLLILLSSVFLISEVYSEWEYYRFIFLCAGTIVGVIFSIAGFLAIVTGGGTQHRNA